METLIHRPEYLNKLKSWQGQTELVKIITGARRCGKSKLFAMFQLDLQMKSKIANNQIININLEDPLQTREIGLTLNKEKLLVDYYKVLDFVIKKLNPNKMNYVFIDEIQLLRDWHQVANGLRLHKNVDVYLTGSNAYMFSSDLANSFGGRYIEIKMQPFSFKEYYSAYSLKAGLRPIKNSEEFLHKYDLQNVYSTYVRESGFPQTTEFFGNRQLINDYLMNTVYLNTIQKDIVQRFNISDAGKLDAVVRFMFDNIGKETSIRGIERGLKAAGHSVSIPTISNYIQGLLDSYLLYKCDRYDIKGKQLLDSNSKYYVADIGLKTALLGNEDSDIGYGLENVVYLELLRRGYQVSVGKVKTKVVKNDGKSEKKTIEVDFIARKPGEDPEYYQVSLYALEPETLSRELAPLEEIDDNYPKFLLSMDYGSGTNKGIKRLNVLEWLIGGNEQKDSIDKKEASITHKE
ncbi:MAG: ATP-binding protein [Endomicrobia bacterium]|nr:ATP-binding protein [Endomicrobiia bacterium]MCL2506175.1 ATP-binding protein [Endomicrobiia bacterium]